MTPDAPRRLTRRRLLALGGAGAAAAGAAGVLAWARAGGAGVAATAPPASVTAAPTAPATATLAVPRGGIARVTAAASFNFDTFDAQRTGEPSVAEVLGRTHSRLARYGALPGMSLAGDLARSWESPDSETLLFHLDPNARWWGDGALVTASDVAANFTRMLSLVAAGGLPLAQRAEEYGTVRRVTARPDGVVAFELAAPAPMLLDTLAGRFALVQSPLAVKSFESTWSKLRPNEVVGSGPFQLTSTDAGELAFKASATAHRRANLDGLRVHQPGNDVDSFIAADTDEVLTRDRRDAPRVRAANTGASELSRFEDSPVMSSFFVGAPPWNNPELLRALSAALNRSRLSELLFGSRAAACGPVSPATPAFVLTDAELAAFPGYRPDAAADAADARARWSAAGGPGLGAITIDVPNIFDPLYSAGATITGLLREALGNDFRASVETYTTIAAKAAAGRYGNGRAAFWFGWGTPLASPDPVRAFVETYDARSPSARALGAPAGLEGDFDALTVASGDDRAARVRALCKRLLDTQSGAVIPWLLQRSELFRSPALHAAAPTPFWGQDLDAESWRD